MIRRVPDIMKFQKVLIVLLVLSFTTPVNAAEPTDHEGWNYRSTIYLWGANLTANLPGTDNDPVPFYKLLDHLKMGFMGTFQARKDKWSFNLDVIYMDVQDKVSRSFDIPQEGQVDLRVKADLKGLVMTPNVGYAIVDSDKSRVELLGGLRYLDLSLKANLKANDTVLLDGKVSRGDWDGIIGVRATLFLNEKWYLPLYGDIGTGDSDVTWQLGAGFGYRFDKVNVTVAYRYLKYEFDSGSNAILDNLTMKGPALGFSFYF